MKESSKGQVKDLWVREDRGDFGPDGIGDDLQWFLDNWQTVRELRIGSNKCVQRSWNELLITCKQVWVTSDFIPSNWPLECVATDEAEWEVAEHMFSDSALDAQTRQYPDCSKGEERLRRLDDMAKTGEIRLCGVRRAMEYVSTHLDVQLNHMLIVPVIGRCSLHGFGSIDCFPVFYTHHRICCLWRKLSLYSVSDKFNPSCGWLILRKRQA